MAEQKRKLEEEKAKLQKEIEEQKRKLEKEKLFYDLEPKYKKKCQKKMFNDLYEVGTPEYKQCIINKGPKKQIEEQKLKEKQNEEKTAEIEKIRLEQKKLEAQKKAEEKKRLEQKKIETQKKAKEDEERLKHEKLAAEKKAKEEEERKKQVEKQKFKSSGRLKCHMTLMTNLNTDVVKDVSNVRPRSYFYFNYDKTSLKINWTNTDGTRSNEVFLIKDFRKFWKEEHNGYSLRYEFIEKSSNKLHSEMILAIDTWTPTKAVAVATSKISYLNFIYECSKL